MSCVTEVGCLYDIRKSVFPCKSVPVFQCRLCIYYNIVKSCALTSTNVTLITEALIKLLWFLMLAFTFIFYRLLFSVVSHFILMCVSQLWPVFRMCVRSKGKGLPRTGHEDPEGEQMYNSTLPSTSALVGCGWWTPLPGRFTPRKETRYPLYSRLGVPQDRSGQVRKISLPTGVRSLDRPAVASHYTDCVFQALMCVRIHVKIKCGNYLIHSHLFLKVCLYNCVYFFISLSGHQFLQLKPNLQIFSFVCVRLVHSNRNFYFRSQNTDMSKLIQSVNW